MAQKPQEQEAINSPPRDLEVDQVGTESFSGTATEEGVSDVVHFIRLLQKEPRIRDSPLPSPQKSPSPAQEMGKHPHVQLWLQGLTTHGCGFLTTTKRLLWEDGL